MKTTALIALSFFLPYVFHPAPRDNCVDRAIALAWDDCGFIGPARDGQAVAADQ